MSRHYSFLFASCHTLVRLRKRLKEHTNPNRYTQTKVLKRILGKTVSQTDTLIWVLLQHDLIPDNTALLGNE